MFYIPGCPPTPADPLYGFAMALGLLEQKIYLRKPGEEDNQSVEILHPNMVRPSRVRIDRAARRLAGYSYGRQIADKFINYLMQGKDRGAQWLAEENDPRLSEIVANLSQIVDQECVK